MAKEDVIQKIVDATLEIVAREKISGTRMHLIAKEAELSQSNLHYYFPTKDDLLIAVLDKIQERFSEKRKEVVNLEENSFDENLQGLFKEKKEDILFNKKYDYVQFDYLVQGTVNPEIRTKFQSSFNIWRNTIKDVIMKDTVLTEKEAKHIEMLPFLIVSLMMGASMQYLIDEGKFDLDEYFKMAEKMISSLRCS